MWHLFVPQVLVLFTSVIHLLLLRLFELVNLLVVRLGILYTRAGSSINGVISILFDGENIKFDASLVIYINTSSTNIPPIMIMNRMYENQNLLYIVPLMRHTIVVCISSISPMAIACFICVNINLVIVLIDIINFVVSGGILFKMLVLGINEVVFAFPLKF